jgi:SPP1 gp7 family putative phage head morphogenesis protein
MAVNANTQLYDNIVDRAAMIRLYEQKVQNKVELINDGHAVRVDKLIREAKKSDKGFIKLREAIDADLQSTYGDVFSIHKRSLLDLFTDQVSWTYQNIETAIGEIWRTKRPKRRVAEEIVLDKPLHQDQTLSQGWANISVNERIRLEGVIRRGIAEGWEPDRIATEVRRGNVHNITRNQSRGLVVTSITSVHNQADHAVYKTNEKAIKGWQYVAVLDSRTTPICAHRDGTIYPVGDTKHLPPAHWRCRSTTVPVFHSWEDMAKLEGVAEIRRRNLKRLTPAQKAFYDGQTPLRESYNDWLKRQPVKTQLKHLGDYKKVELLNTGQLTVDKFYNAEGKAFGIKELRAATDLDYVIPGDTRRFANAKDKLDAMRLSANTPDDLKDIQSTLIDYYILQSGDLNGLLSFTNYRGTLIHTKRNTRNRVLSSPPTEEQLKYNPLTGRYDDVRIYQPNSEVFAGAIKRVDEDPKLKKTDIEFIKDTLDKLSMKMSMNERAVIADNLRIVIGRYRTNKEPWGNLKAVIQSQIKFDIMNISDNIETQIRKDRDVLKKLSDEDYIDPVLGRTQLDILENEFIPNIIAKNRWEDTTAPAIARELRDVFDRAIPFKIRRRLSDDKLARFYLGFAQRLGMADSPDRDSFAISLGRDLYNLANINGTRREWHNLGRRLLDRNAGHLFQINTFGVQKRRMRSRMSGQYFGPYYDTVSYYLDIQDPRIVEYAKLTRKVDLGLRVAVTKEKNKLLFREGYKTYFINTKTGMYDTRIPIISTHSFSSLRTDFIDKDLVDAINWMGSTKYKIDEDFYDFIEKLLYFKDDRGNAKKYDDLNHYRKYITTRGDSYERFKSMQWLRQKGIAFSNHPFIDSRARVYDRGFISPQAGESFRPFLNTDKEQILGKEGYDAFTDQIGSFLGGLSDFFEGNYDSLTFKGRQQIAKKWWTDLVKIGNSMIKAKPNDIRFILEHPMTSQIDGEELGKFFRFAVESAKIDNHLKDGGTVDTYKTALAMEQDASSSGAQIIALTTRNKQLAELSNVVPTNHKKRLYDEIAASTWNDPRFKTINERLGLNLKDLQKAAKAQNMVTFYGAGERTGILNVEGKLSKALGKQENTLVVTAGDRDKVLNEISARIARVERYSEGDAEELRQLRAQVRDIFNKGMDPGDDIMHELYFLDPKTKDLVDKLSQQYESVITPDDFKGIARIMSEHLAEQVPILKDFTRYFGRLAEDFLINSKPSNTEIDWKTVAEISLRGEEKKRAKLPRPIAELLGLPANTPISEQLLQKFPSWNPNSGLATLLFGAQIPETRLVGKTLFKIDVGKLGDLFKGAKDLEKASSVTIARADLNKVPNAWTNVPWVNFDGKVLEQSFTQSFEERLVYRDETGNWVTNILHIPQKTEATWWDQVFNKDGKINDIANATKARTAYAVNGNHSNDAVIVKKFHLWGRKNNIATSSIHDAFFTNIADLLKGRNALKDIYAQTLEKNVVKMVLDEMLARGLPKDIYQQYLDEAIDKGLIPVPGKSVIGGKVISKDDILTPEDIREEIPFDFEENYGWYGVG